jgi:branched-subunit amino acid transport protein
MTANDLIYLLLLVVATAVTRSTLVLLGSRIRMPERLDAALRFAPACALSAILLPQLAMNSGGQLVDWPGSALLWAAVATAATMWVRGGILLAITLGMAAFWLSRALGSPV